MEDTRPRQHPAGDLRGGGDACLPRLAMTVSGTAVADLGLPKMDGLAVLQS
ncbi:hypothetical protein [Novosphingobium guangzhouense]|uniref:hypothetical protein n=1 Tax=Novosphingobium guangzhouense TaxID=1850347 RepID=UPI001472F5AD|nr:hypothetical protein [Novosphingobium guangzhouense]